MHRLLRAAARLPVLAAGLTLAATGVAGAHAGPRSDHHRPSSVVGHLYVNDNTAPANTIAGFDRHADGSLTPIPGSPFATGGAGTGAVIGSQGALQITAGGHALLAVDPGSNDISELLVGRDGRLWPLPGGTVSSQGKEPLSIAVARGLVYVANARRGRQQLRRFQLRSLRAAAPDSRCHVRAARCGPARRRPDQLNRDQARRHARRHLPDRQLRDRPGRPPARSLRFAVHRPGPRPVRERVQSDRP